MRKLSKCDKLLEKYLLHTYGKATAKKVLGYQSDIERFQYLTTFHLMVKTAIWVKHGLLNELKQKELELKK